jgi:hypothetical protein
VQAFPRTANAVPAKRLTISRQRASGGGLILNLRLVAVRDLGLSRLHRL